MQRAVRTTISASVLALFPIPDDGLRAPELALEEGRRPKAARIRRHLLAGRTDDAVRGEPAHRPFGASCVLVFGLPQSPLAQPRNVIGGHLVSTVTGLVVLSLLGPTAAAYGLGVGLAIVAMLVTKTVPPRPGPPPSSSSWQAPAGASSPSPS